MSLDVYLTVKGPGVATTGSAIFIRENGTTREISREEWDRRFPDTEPVEVCINETTDTRCVYSDNVTHNLGKMTAEAGIYKALWRPDEIGITRASELAPLLETGLALLKSDPERFRVSNPSNGWGTYEGLVEFVEDYLGACREWPDAEVEVSR